MLPEPLYREILRYHKFCVFQSDLCWVFGSCSVSTCRMIKQIFSQLLFRPASLSICLVWQCFKCQRCLPIARPSVNFWQGESNTVYMRNVSDSKEIDLLLFYSIHLHAQVTTQTVFVSFMFISFHFAHLSTVIVYWAVNAEVLCRLWGRTEAAVLLTCCFHYTAFVEQSKNTLL